MGSEGICSIGVHHSGMEENEGGRTDGMGWDGLICFCVDNRVVQLAWDGYTNSMELQYPGAWFMDIIRSPISRF